MPMKDKAAKCAYNKAYYRNRFDKGMCRTCAKPREPDRVLCRSCANRRKIAESRRRAAVVDAGLCCIGGCGNPRDGTHDKCKRHREHYNAYHRAYQKTPAMKRKRRERRIERNIEENG